MEKKILVITSSFDRTCDYIIAKYDAIDFFRLNTDNFSDYSLSYDLAGFKIRKMDGEEICTSNCKSIYYRKPFPEDLTGTIESKYISYSHKESFSLIEGIVESFSGRCLSRPSIMRRADNKITQACIAQQVGFNIPPLLITNDPLSLRVLDKINTIVKPLSLGSITHNSQKEFVQTNKYDSGVLKNSLKYSPAYFQKYINKDYEARVTFVDKKAFSIKINSKNKIDWRKKDNDISYEIINLPDEIYKKCLSFMTANNISFGCFDFIIDNNTWHFLEMNANGQWAWLEFSTGINISNSIVEYLNNE